MRMMHDIHNLHLSFGWDGIGYHKIILRNGIIQNGRPEYWVGAHVYGKNTEKPRDLFDWKRKFYKMSI